MYKVLVMLLFRNDTNYNYRGKLLKGYDQLTSEYGEKFTVEAAQYVVDNIHADWNGNALKKAQMYQIGMDMSPSAVYDQLILYQRVRF